MSGLHGAVPRGEPTVARTRKGAIHARDFHCRLLTDIGAADIQEISGLEYIGRSKHILFTFVRRC